MNAEMFVCELEARGLSLSYEDGGLVIEQGPDAPALSARERALLRKLRASMILTLRARSTGVEWTRISLIQLESVLEVAVPWSDMPLLLAPGCRIARELRASDAEPGRVWCVCEICDLLLSGVKPEDVQGIGEAKLLFRGRVVGVTTALDSAGKPMQTPNRSSTETRGFGRG